MSIFCIGQAVYDITAYLDAPLEANRKYRVLEHSECAGAPALNAACLCALWGAPTELVARIGEDSYGDAVRESLRRFGVGASHLIPDAGLPTPFSLIAVEKATGSRTIFNFPGERADVPYAAPPERPDVILSDGHEPEASLAVIRAHPDAPSVIDAGTCRQGVVEVARESAYIVCSEDFALQLTGRRVDLSDMAGADAVLTGVERLNEGVAVVTLGERGLIYRDGAGVARHMPAFPARAVDTTGAGDIFHGAFAYGLYAGLSIEENLRWSSMASSLSVRKMGGQTSIPLLSEVQAALEAARV